MLRWTPSGAVTLPDTVQIRVEVSYPDRLPAGAPSPTRRLEPNELIDNIVYFTKGLDTPRTRPCVSMVLSGHGVATRSDIPTALRQARALGVRWTVLHAGHSELDRIDVSWMDGLVDRLVLPVHRAAPLDRYEHLVAACRARAISVVFAVDLRASLLPDLPEVAGALDALKPAAIVFTWPFPMDGLPAERASEDAHWREQVERGLQAVQNAPALVRGLPICYLPQHPSLFRRTSNRWYVDAAHQKQHALLFLPDVVQFDKADACRFCTMDHLCDGFFQPYLAQGHRPLQPV
ncbi:MAG TPA: hypothetical protein DFR83_18790 [Deltaproteobacteria bacterium]|nr:hypothetical protein [Deltaproteobacteria bacterium]